MAEMARVDSEKIISQGLNVFKVPPTDISIDAYRMVTIHPTTTAINPLEFIIPALDDHVDLNRSYFTMDLRLKKDNAGNQVAGEKLWVTNNHAGPAEGTKLHARKNFCVFYPIELKLCTMIELFIPNNRIVFVFSF